MTRIFPHPRFTSLRGEKWYYIIIIFYPLRSPNPSREEMIKD